MKAKQLITSPPGFTAKDMFWEGLAVGAVEGCPMSYGTSAICSSQQVQSWSLIVAALLMWYLWFYPRKYYFQNETFNELYFFHIFNNIPNQSTI